MLLMHGTCAAMQAKRDERDAGRVIHRARSRFNNKSEGHKSVTRMRERVTAPLAELRHPPPSLSRFLFAKKPSS